MARTLIQTVTVGSGGSSTIDFTSIPGTYTDLQLVVSGRGTNAAIGSELLIRFNGDTGFNYAYKYFRGSGSAVNTSQSTSSDYAYGGYISGASSTASTFGNTNVFIPNYTTALIKAVLAESVSENNATASWQMTTASVWSTSVITSMTLSLYGANFAEYSSATLYGIKSGSSGGVTVS